MLKDTLLPWTCLMALLRRLQCLYESCSNMARATCAFCEISNGRSSLVLAGYINFILIEANLLNSVLLELFAILFK